MHLFGKPSRVAHPFIPTLERWLARTPPDHYSAMACNLAHDHRVTAQRAERLEKYFADAIEPDDDLRLEAAIRRYFERQVQLRRVPAFLDVPTNGSNILPCVAKHFTTAEPKGSLPRRPGPPHADLWLARLLVLNGLIAPFLSARAAGNKVFKDFPRLPRRALKRTGDSYQREILAWLDTQLLGKSSSEQAGFVTGVLEALEQTRKKKPYQPSWATYWRHFERHLPFPERWASVVGVPNRWPSERWLLVLKYRVRETGGGLVRPTVLDSGFNPYHFPSPPKAELERGGHPMDLRLSPRPDRLLPEFIHQQIEHVLGHWQDAGFLLTRTNQPPDGLLVERRRNHYELLARVYGKSVRGWMDRCI